MITEQQVVVTSVLVCLVGLVAFTIGLWTGHGRDREYTKQLEDELEELLALGKRPPEVAHEPWPVHVDQALAVARQEQEGHYENLGCEADRVAATGRAAVPAHSPRPDPYPGPFQGPDPRPGPLEPAAVIPPDPEASVTGWTKAMAADMDRFIAGLIADTDEQLKDITR